MSISSTNSLNGRTDGYGETISVPCLLRHPETTQLFLTKSMHTFVVAATLLSIISSFTISLHHLVTKDSIISLKIFTYSHGLFHDTAIP